MSGGGDKILKRWNLPTTELSSQHNTHNAHTYKLIATHSIRAHDKDINSIDISPNDMIIASGSQDKSIRLWNSLDLTPIATLNGHKRGVWKVLFSAIDKVLASCSSDRTIKLWSIVDYTVIHTFEGHTASVLTIQFINTCTQIISGSADGLIRLWTIRTGECDGVSV